MANFIGRLGVLLGLDSAEFQRGIQKASKDLDNFVAKTKVSAGVAATAFAAMTYQAMQLADEIVDTAKANDIAVDSILKLRNALALSGGDAQNAGKLISSFTANIDKAAEGSFEMQKTLKGVGVSLDDLRKLSVDELMTKTFEGLAKMEDPLTRNAKAMELFGKAAKGVDFANLSTEIANSTGATEKQAKAIEDAAAAYDTLAKAGRDFSIMLAVELGPNIKTTIDFIGGMEKSTSLMGATVRTVFETIVLFGSDVIFVYQGIADAVMHVGETLKLLGKGKISEAFELDDKHFAKWDKKRAELDEFQRRVAGGGGGYGGGVSDFKDPRLSMGASEAAEPVRTVKKGIDKEAEAKRKKELLEAEALRKKQQDLLMKGFQEEQREREESRRLLAEQQTEFLLGNKAVRERQNFAEQEVERAKENLELIHAGRNLRGEDLQLAQELQQIEWRRIDARKEINADDKLTREGREAALLRENELAEKAIELARQRNELAKQVREGTMAEGFFDAMAMAARNATTEFERGQQAFQAVMGNMEAAINQFVQTGKLSFKDFAASIIRELIAIQMKAQAMSFIRMMFGGFAGLGIGSVGNAATMAPGGGYFADGGNPPVGKVSVVGERGPELFVPRTAGTIIPNNRLSDAMGGGGPSVTYNGPYIANMSAIDTQSSVQFLAKNKQAVWAANQSAQRSLPVSR